MAMSAFQSMKHEIVQFASLSKDALHIYVGMGVFLLGSAVAQKGLRSAFAILASCSMRARICASTATGA